MFSGTLRTFGFLTTMVVASAGCAHSNVLMQQMKLVAGPALHLNLQLTDIEIRRVSIEQMELIREDCINHFGDHPIYDNDDDDNALANEFVRESLLLQAGVDGVCRFDRIAFVSIVIDGRKVDCDFIISEAAMQVSCELAIVAIVDVGTVDADTTGASLSPECASVEKKWIIGHFFQLRR